MSFDLWRTHTTLLFFALTARDVTPTSSWTSTSSTLFCGTQLAVPVQRVREDEPDWWKKGFGPQHESASTSNPTNHIARNMNRPGLHPLEAVLQVHGYTHDAGKRPLIFEGT